MSLEEPLNGRVDLRWGPYCLFRFDSDARLVLIEDGRHEFPPDEDAAAWNAAVFEARTRGYRPFDDEPDLEAGPLMVYFLVPLPLEV